MDHEMNLILIYLNGGYVIEEFILSIYIVEASYP